MVGSLLTWLRVPARRSEKEAHREAEATGAVSIAIAAETEEAAWVALACRGDQTAIGWLIDRHRERVVRLAAHVLRQPDEAEDAAQEAFLRAFRSLHTFRRDARFTTWLYRITLNVCLDQRRLKRRARETSLQAPEHQPALSHQPTPDAEARVLVETLLDRLTPPMRAMLVLREQEGLEYEEIAHVLEIPVGRVKWRLHQARAQFRTLWSEMQQETDDV